MTTVHFNRTPNPNAGKFVVSRPVVEGKASKSFYNAGQAAGTPVAESLFGLKGVASVFMVEDFITVTKAVDADWAELAPKVIETIAANLD
jgi:hypothetical protein